MAVCETPGSASLADVSGLASLIWRGQRHSAPDHVLIVDLHTFIRLCAHLISIDLTEDLMKELPDHTEHHRLNSHVRNDFYQKQRIELERGKTLNAGSLKSSFF